MDFELTESQRMTRDVVREFAEREIVPHSLEWDEAEHFPDEVLRKMGELGLLGIFVPTSYGGSGLDTTSYAIAIEELSKADASAGVYAAVNNGLACEPLLSFGSESQKERYLRKLATGEWTGAYALTEPNAGSDAAALRMTARLEKGEWVLDGTKAFVTGAERAKLVVTYAITDAGLGHRGISAFLVETSSPGFKRIRKERKMGIKASDTLLLAFDECRVPEENMLGTRGEGFKIAMSTLDGGRIGIAAQSVGIAQRAHEESVKYSKERQAFGEKIAKFQAIQWKLADMATELEAARLLTYRAASLRDSGQRYTLEASMAKLFASEMCNKVVKEAVQIHGGYGYIRDYVVEKLYRDAKITEIYEGTSEIQRLVISRSILKEI